IFSNKLPPKVKYIFSHKLPSKVKYIFFFFIKMSLKKIYGKNVFLRRFFASQHVNKSVYYTVSLDYAVTFMNVVTVILFILYLFTYAMQISNVCTITFK